VCETISLRREDRRAQTAVGGIVRGPGRFCVRDNNASATGDPAERTGRGIAARASNSQTTCTTGATCNAKRATGCGSQNATELPMY